MAMRALFKNYSLHEAELDSPAETVLSLDSVPLTAYTRKLRSNVSREALQDIKTHLTDAEKEIEALMVNEIADSIDQDIIGYMISIARKADVKTIDSTDNQGVLNVMSRLGFDVLANSRKSLSMFAVVSPKVAATLLSSYQYAFQNDNYEHNVSDARFIGEIGPFMTFININATEDGVLIGYKDKGVLEAGLAYSPYVVSTYTVDDYEDTKTSIIHSVRGGFAVNPLDSGKGEPDSSDFFSYCKINIQD
jgi:hypothetical protein